MKINFETMARILHKLSTSSKQYNPVDDDFNFPDCIELDVMDELGWIGLRGFTCRTNPYGWYMKPVGYRIIQDAGDYVAPGEESEDDKSKGNQSRLTSQVIERFAFDTDPISFMRNMS